MMFAPDLMDKKVLGGPRSEDQGDSIVSGQHQFHVA